MNIEKFNIIMRNLHSLLGKDYLYTIITAPQLYKWAFIDDIKNLRYDSYKDVAAASVHVTSMTFDFNDNEFKIVGTSFIKPRYKSKVYTLDDFGKTVFFNREDAEAKVAEIKNTRPAMSIINLLEDLESQTGSLAVADVIDDIKDNIGQVSDGYHTFNELYDHRAALTAALFKNLPGAFKAKLHADGTMYDDMFIVGATLPNGKFISYHYDIDPWWDIFDVPEIDHAPKWDGHTPADVVNYLIDYAKPDQ